MARILEVQADWKYGRAAAMAWSYFVIVLVVVAIVSAIMNKFIYYDD
jgi:ABC-type sugar transport system permease subunit